jgi:hypothetical protein
MVASTFWNFNNTGNIISVTIDAGIVSGEFPKRALAHVQEWYEPHKADLLADWDLVKERKPLNKVAPLE